MKHLRWSSGILLALVCVILIGRLIAILGSAPRIDGRVELAGIGDKVEVIRDENGVPHIFGTSDNDVFFGLGFVHAQDRLWQMEFSRRLARGRLSEILGRSTLDFDRFFRTLSLGDKVTDLHSRLSPSTRDALVAYAAGVNAAIDDASTPLPPEFAILMYEPEPWTALDSLLIPKLMSLGLSTNMFHEIQRLHLLRKLGPEKLDQFFNDGPIRTTEIDPEILSLYRSLPDTAIASLPYDPVSLAASNNWVVDGSLTASGRPLLANDPHLELNSPSVWYLAHLKLKSGNIAGGTLPGLPSIILGRNDHIAWGFTNTGADVQDLYIEQVNPDKPDEYLTPDGYVPFRTHQDVIKVRFGDDVPITLRETRHGPVMPVNWQGSGKVLSDRYVLSLAWTALADEDRTPEASLGMMQAKSWLDFVLAVKHVDHPMQNIVFADRKGHIGFIAPARVPIRHKDNELSGLFPAPGWRAEYDWQGFIPFDELPRSFGARDGRIFTANNKIVPEDYPYWITNLWEHPHRYRRIEDLLTQTRALSVDDFKSMQRDTYSQDGIDLKPWLETIETDDPTVQQAIDIVSRWNGRMDREQIAPAIYMAWLRELTRLLYADELGDTFSRNWSLNIDFVLNALEGNPPAADWCNNITTAVTETCRQVSAQAFERAIEYLQDRYGDDVQEWQWGRAHVAIHAHNPFEQFPVLGSVFSRRVASDGGFFTLNRGGHRLSAAEPFANIHGSGYRAIYDLAAPEQSAFMQSTGQSGNPVSNYFGNFVEPWADGAYITIATDRAAVSDGASSTLILMPRDPD